jgi:hypothetical protein
LRYRMAPRLGWASSPLSCRLESRRPRKLMLQTISLFRLPREWFARKLVMLFTVTKLEHISRSEMKKWGLITKMWNISRISAQTVWN